jgi:hypothetical protein
MLTVQRACERANAEYARVWVSCELELELYKWRSKSFRDIPASGYFHVGNIQTTQIKYIRME